MNSMFDIMVDEKELEFEDVECEFSCGGNGVVKIYQSHEHVRLKNQLRMKHKWNIASDTKMLNKYAYRDDKHGCYVTPMASFESSDKILTFKLDIPFNEWNSSNKNTINFINDLAIQLNINPNKIVLISSAQGSTKNSVAVCGILEEEMPYVNKKIVSFTNGDDQTDFGKKWMLKSCELNQYVQSNIKKKIDNDSSNGLCDSLDDDKSGDDNSDDGLNEAHTFLKEQAKILRQLLTDSIQKCGEEYEIRCVMILDNDKVLKRFTKTKNWQSQSKLLFHGCSRNGFQAYESIYSSGFDDKYIGTSLDAGWYGKGHYFSSFPEYSMKSLYTSKNACGQMTLFAAYCNVGANDEIKKLYEKDTGAPIANEHFSHYVRVDQSGYPISKDDIENHRPGEDMWDEWVIKTGAQILPRYCITFVRKYNVIVWRDPNLFNAENSYILDQLRKQHVTIYGATTTDQALTVIGRKQSCGSNNVYIITNGTDESLNFVESVRKHYRQRKNSVEVDSPVLVFTMHGTKEKFAHLSDVDLCTSSGPVFEFVKKHA